jgi:redox-sensitive bicupin YhaK (pirin superfamily)
VASNIDESAKRHCVTRDFGALRVLNEEWLAAGCSIPLHSHENMEILTLALSGVLRHEDSRGASHVIAPGEIHLLSAGLGMTHREFNHSTASPAHYLQAWLTPKRTRTPTRYGHGVVPAEEITGRFLLAAGPPGSGSVVEINQDAYVSLIRLHAGATATYARYAQANGLYLFLLEGRLDAGTQLLVRGEGLGVPAAQAPACTALQESTLLCIEVPLQDYQL